MQQRNPDHHFHDRYSYQNYHEQEQIDLSQQSDSAATNQRDYEKHSSGWKASNTISTDIVSDSNNRQYLDYPPDNYDSPDSQPASNAYSGITFEELTSKIVKPQNAGSKSGFEEQQQQPTSSTRPSGEQRVVSTIYDIDFNQPPPSEDLLDIAAEDPASGSGVSTNPQQYQQFLQDRIIQIDEPETIFQNFLTSYKLYTIKSRKVRPDYESKEKKEYKVARMMRKNFGQQEDEIKYDTVVRRRFSDFEFLQKQLIEDYGGCLIPVLPEKNFWTCFNLEGAEYTAFRAKRLVKYLNSLLCNQRIRMSKQLRLFLFVDSAQFSENKGEFQEKLKVEDRIYSVLQSAVGLGQDLLAKYLPSTGTTKPQSTLTASSVQIIRSNENTRLTEFEVSVGVLNKICKGLRVEIENRHKQKQILDRIEYYFSRNNNAHNHYQHNIDNSDDEDRIVTEFNFQLLQQFQVQPAKLIKINFILCFLQDTSEHIESCLQALNRRNRLAQQIQQMRAVQAQAIRKQRHNPRSKQIDLIKVRIKKNTDLLQKWTSGLNQEMEKAIYTGRTMLGSLVNSYLQYRSTEFLKSN